MSIPRSKVTPQRQAGPAPDRVNAQRRFKVNLVIYLGVNALLAITWLAVTVAGIPMTNVALSLAIYVGMMGLWGARLVFEGLRAYRRRTTR